MIPSFRESGQWGSGYFYLLLLFSLFIDSFILFYLFILLLFYGGRGEVGERDKLYIIKLLQMISDSSVKNIKYPYRPNWI